ncbi:MAG: tetratricopeptide repeat protein [Bacteroidota bacterium]
MYKSFTILLVLLLTLTCFAQTNTEKLLATQYYQNEEYDKALVLYENFFNKTHLDFYYNYYLNCLLELEDFKKAEKVIKKQIKKDAGNLNYVVDLGFVYHSSGEINKSKQQYERAIKQLMPDMQQVIKLANAFLAKGETDYAIETYLKGKKLFNDFNSFSFELAEIYALSGKITLMINEYLDFLFSNSSFKERVQNALQTKFFNDPNIRKNEILKTQLLKRIQKYPDKSVFAEILIWYYIQQKDFEAAFVQAKALDRRMKEDGERIMNLAKLSASSKNYDIAIKCYQYVITKGKDTYHYINSKMELLNVMNQKITCRGEAVTCSYTEDDLIELEKNYYSTIEELGKSSRTVSLLRGLAHLQAFYLYKTNEAISILENSISMPQVQANDLAVCKLELADILLLIGEVWDASLYYSQVEKAFKHEPIGHEAKFRNAKLSYYKGEFEWSQAQLDVLKASTSKLIANDALNLSLLISDNTALDTSTTALLMYANADLLFFQNKDDLALKILDSIISLFPGHSLIDEIIYKKSGIMIKKGRFEEAAELLKIIVKDYSYDILADDALFNLAELYENHFNNTEKAMELYQQLLINFPGSLYTVEARERFRILRGDNIN